MKSMEIKRISGLSVFKFFGGMFLISGLLLGLFGRFIGMSSAAVTLSNLFPFMAEVPSGILTGILFGVLYGLIAGVVFTVLALVYNVFAGVLGGVKVSVKEEV